MQILTVVVDDFGYIFCSVLFFEASLVKAGCTGIVAKGGMEVYTPGVYGDVLRSFM